MPFYDYYCPANQRTVEVKHSMQERLKTWGEVCALAQISIDDTSADALVERLVSAPQIQHKTSDSRIKELGFTKLVKKDKGVYENVTASGSEKKIVKANDMSSYPHFNKKVKD